MAELNSDASAGAKFRLLMWKNFLMQWRHPKQTAAELLVPVLAMALILVLRSQVEPTMENQTNYPTIPAYSLNYSSVVFAGMNFTNGSRLSIAYSPTSDVLDDVIRTSLVNMIARNVHYIISVVLEQFPELQEILPPTIPELPIDIIMDLLKGLIQVDAYDTGSELSSIYGNEEATRRVIAAVEFPDSMLGKTELNMTDLSYSLRFPEKPRLNSFFARGGRSWRTTLVFPAFPLPGPRFPYSHEGGNDPGYVNEMFIALQNSISTELISRMTNRSTREFNVNIQRYPHPAYTVDLAVQVLQLLFPMFIILSFNYTVINITRAVTLEKELQLKETMKIMGLPTWLHWSAWFCKQFIIMFIVTIFIVILLKVNFFTTEEGISDYAVFTYTPWTVLMFFMLIYLISAIFLCFMVSSFFSKASTAALFMGIIWYVLYIPAVILAIDENLSIAVQVILCLSINTAMSYGFQVILAAEPTGAIQWGSFFHSAQTRNPRLLFGHVVLIIIFDSVLYMLVALYLEQVFPGPYGSPRPWYFPFQKKFWFSTNIVHSEDFVDENVELIKEKDPTEDFVDENVELIKEKDPTGHAIGVKIQNLKKIYGLNTAVNNLSLDIFDDQITVLLGHNGAGKSTTISMLTGNVSPSSGSIWLAGYDVRRQLREARAQVGLCPQHNVLFPELTVQEHLHFFGRLKGLTGDELTQEIDMLIERLELKEKRNYKSGGLSGGQKRRLSVGIALCGGAKVVLLDEPTSGMDPSSRRALWELLQNEKKGRALILTTHFMDEADYLGDRIAIMSAGRLQCVGSPYFLKRHYGVGYTLVVVKERVFQPQLCTELINKYIPNSFIKEDRGTEVTYELSNDYSHLFEQILTDLENNRTKIGFVNYGLMATTMEDVFMSVGSDMSPSAPVSEDSECANSESTEEMDKQYNDGHSEEFVLENPVPMSRVQILRCHVHAMWLKLWLVWSRSWGLLLLQILVPIAIMNMTLGLVQYMISLNDNIMPRPLTLAEGFTRTETYLSISDGAPLGTLEAYKSLFNGGNTLTLIDSSQSMEDYYLNKSSDIVSLGTMRQEVVIGATFSENGATAWFSNFGYHDVAISLATVHRALLRAINPDADLKVTNHPLEANYENSDDMQLIVLMLSSQFSSGLGNSISIVCAVFIMFYIKERVSRAKLLQKASGIQPIVMWGSAAVFDWLWFMIICLTFIISCLIFQVTGLSSAVELGRMFLLLMIFGAAVIPLTYMLSYLFNGPAFGFVVVVFTNSLFGMMGAQIVEALGSLDVDPKIPLIMDRVLQFFPLYSLVTSTKRIHETSLTEWYCMQACEFISTALGDVDECTMEVACRQTPNSCCVRENPYFEWDEPGVLRYMMCMVGSCLLFWLILMFAEYRLYQKIFNRKVAPPPLDESILDDDVLQEIKHVNFISDTGLKQHNLVARGLTKYYNKNLAVNQVSFSVGENECFGLLGVNGAGKTTTFKMLMGDELVSSGDAFVRGHSVTKDIKRVHENIGYCPQFDALFDELTGRETLRLYALLRGLRPETIVPLTRQLARSLGFTKHLDKRVNQYSGGNKRKLSTAVALMGYARVVFLDEPTTGVDPAARRQVWTAIRKATQSGKSVVLTSHSMEECEALCSRLTIMVNGQFKCLGTPQHLKNKFSEGFTLTIKLKLTEDPRVQLNRTAAIKEFVNIQFTNPKLMEEYQGLLTYYLQDRSMPWSRMFGIMERAKRELQVEDYTISQTTLEQIFLQFTKYQQESL